MKGIGLIVGLSALQTAGPAAAALKTVDGEVCFDQLIVGTVRGYGEVFPLIDLNGDAWFGARYELRVAVDDVLEGKPPPRRITVRAVMTSRHTLPVTMIFYIQREPKGSYWAADWRRLTYDGADRIELPDQPPPRCPA